MLPWFRTFDDRHGVVARLFCFPHAGGAASAFSAWNRLLPGEIEPLALQLPGRENRAGEPPLRRMTDLVPMLADVLAGVQERHSDLPFAFFGHSMGARIAYALTRELFRRGQPTPLHLFLAASRAPHLPPPERMMSELGDADFEARIVRMGGTPEAVLRSRAMMDAILPTIRADFELFDAYRATDGADPAHRLRLGVSLWGGREDQIEPAALEAWRDLVAGPFRFTLLAGGHFFLREQAPTLTREIAVTLFRLIAGVPPFAQSGNQSGNQSGLSPAKGGADA